MVTHDNVLWKPADKTASSQIIKIYKLCTLLRNHTFDGHLTILIIHSECIIRVRYKVRQSSRILH